MNARKITTNGGQARYVFQHETPPDFLIDATPGAREAHSEWLAENLEGQRLRSLWSRSGRDVLTFRQTNPLAADLEQVERAHVRTEEAMNSHGRRAERALRRFDAIFGDRPVDRGATMKIAAVLALERQAEAVIAWATLRTALDERDEANRYAGNPGRHWTTQALVCRDPLRAAGDLNRLADARVNGFDRQAVEKVAVGESEPTTPEALTADAVAKQTSPSK